MPSPPAKEGTSRSLPQSNKCMWHRAFGIALAVSVLAASSSGQEAAETADGGRLCLSSLPRPTAGPPSLSNPTGGLSERSFSVQIDEREPIPLAYDEATWVEELAVAERHLVRIHSEGSVVESFYFKFDSEEPTELCLWFKSLYRTWQLWPLKQCGSWCDCEDESDDR